MKRFLAILLALALISMSTFSVFAESDPSVDIAEFILTWYDSTSSLIDGSIDPDRVVDYYDNNRSKLELLSKIPTAFQPFAKVACNNLAEASDGRYMVAELHRSQVQQLVNSLNDYWKHGGELRNCTLEEAGITYPEGVNVSGAWGYLSGSGPAAKLSSADNGITFNSPVGFTSPDSNTIYVYNGSPYYPPVVYVGGQNIAYQNGVALNYGFYYVLGGGRLWYIGSHAQSSFSRSNTWSVQYNLDSNMNVNNFYCRWASMANRGYYCVNGNRTNLSNSSSSTYEDMLAMFSAAVGLHVTTDDTVDTMIYNAPDNIPYDDDDNVTVLLPIDEPGQPIYLSPTVYGDYVENGNIYNTTNTTNNIVNDNSINDFSTIINEYFYVDSDTDAPSVPSESSGYDDTKLMSKLNQIISKLNDIYDAIKKFDFSAPDFKLPEFQDAEPCYENFSDCFNNLDFIVHLKDFYDSANSSIGDDLDDVYLDDIKTPNSSGSSADVSSSSSSFDLFDLASNTFSGLPELKFFKRSQRHIIRDAFAVLFYAIALCSMWRSFLSVFHVIDLE